MGHHTDSLPASQQKTTFSADFAAMAFMATFAALRPSRADAIDIDSAMGSFGGNTTTRSTPVVVGVEQPPLPPASLTQFMATPGIKQAGPLTHGF